MVPASLIFAAATIAVPAVAGAESLAGLRWKERALVVFAADRSDPDFAAQRRIFDKAGAGNRERDLVLIEAVGNEPAAQDLRRRFGIAPGVFRAVLVGKDGGAKLSEARPIPAERLNETIDAMPMRQDEMRRQTGAKPAR
jgi:hypothetical protein